MVVGMCLRKQFEILINRLQPGNVGGAHCCKKKYILNIVKKERRCRNQKKHRKEIVMVHYQLITTRVKVKHKEATLMYLLCGSGV